jgi:hypothetical protein
MCEGVVHTHFITCPPADDNVAVKHDNLDNSASRQGSALNIKKDQLSEGIMQLCTTPAASGDVVSATSLPVIGVTDSVALPEDAPSRSAGM